MKIASITDLIRNSKKVINWVTDNNETVIIHRQRGNDIVMISFDEWNRLNEKDYLHGYGNETEYLISSKANKKHIDESLKQLERGETSVLNLNDICEE